MLNEEPQLAAFFSPFYTITSTPHNFASIRTPSTQCTRPIPTPHRRHTSLISHSHCKQTCRYRYTQKCVYQPASEVPHRSSSEAPCPTTRSTSTQGQSSSRSQPRRVASISASLVELGSSGIDADIAVLTLGILMITSSLLVHFASFYAS
jgi:hypothetical protein